MSSGRCSIGYQLLNGDIVGVPFKRNKPNPFGDVTKKHIEAGHPEFYKTNYRDQEQARDWGGYYVVKTLPFAVFENIFAKEKGPAQRAAIRLV
jgi:hypothetical protein